VKRETAPTQMHINDHRDPSSSSQSQPKGGGTTHPPATKESEDGMPATSDFVKKLFKSVPSPSPLLQN
jgi:hypothetical protein